MWNKGKNRERKIKTERKRTESWSFSIIMSWKKLASKWNNYVGFCQTFRKSYTRPTRETEFWNSSKINSIWRNAICKYNSLHIQGVKLYVHPWQNVSPRYHFLSPQYDKRNAIEIRLASFVPLSLLRGPIHRISVRGKWVVDGVWVEWNCIYAVRDESSSPLFKQREISANEEEACTLAGLFNLTEFLIKLLFVLHPSPLLLPRSLDVMVSY